MPVTKRPSNKILASLSPDDLAHVFSRLEHVPLEFGQRLYQADETIKYLYFPEAGIVSLISRTYDSSFIEVGMLGREGLAGFSVALGVKRSANDAVVQGAGSAHRILARDFIEMCQTVGRLQQAALRFVHGLMTQTSLAAACNAYHPTDRRLARWLLMTHDRMRTDEFEITQDFLSHMLGVRREAVNRAVGELRRTGLIDFSRAKMKIKDRKGLESIACYCYARIVDAYRKRST